MRQIAADLEKTGDFAGGVLLRREDVVRPKSGAVFPHSPAFVLHTRVQCGVLQLRVRLTRVCRVGWVKPRAGLTDHFALLQPVSFVAPSFQVVMRPC